MQLVIHYAQYCAVFLLLCW